MLIIISLFFPATTFSARKQQVKPYTVTLDPGHGGEDNGATGKLGKKTIHEKDLALGIAIRVSKLLASPKYWKPIGRPIKTFLTRDRDRDVSLEKRSELAKEKKSDLFLSIHINFDTTKKASGIETFFLNNTDKESESKLVEIENKNTKKYAKTKPTSLLISSVTADAVVDNSKTAAGLIHKSVVEHLKLEDIKVTDRGVKQAMFYVLLDAQVPAVLFEAFFISNPKDLEFLHSAENREKIAEGLAQGILRYLAQN